MDKTDFKLFRCPHCGDNYGFYYMPPLSSNPEWRQRELKEYEEDFDVRLKENGKWALTCGRCGKEFEETEPESYKADDHVEILGSLLEDDNRHSITNIGNVFKDCMISAGIEEDKTAAVLGNIVERYSKTHSFC